MKQLHSKYNCVNGLAVAVLQGRLSKAGATVITKCTMCRPVKGNNPHHPWVEEITEEIKVQ